MKIDKKTKIYCCAICVGLISDAKIIGEQIDLKGRQAKCVYCGKIVDSDYNLPFFEYNKNGECDSYYCGCRGWD